MPTPLPERPQPPRTRSGSWLTLFLALLVCLAGAMILLALPTGFIGPVMVFGGLIFFSVIGFHYFVWGRWLSEILKEEGVEERD